MRTVKSVLAWLLVALALALSVAQHLVAEQLQPSGSAGAWVVGLILATLPTLLFAALGALIVSRQGGNRIGWLLVLSAVGGAYPAWPVLDQVPPAGASITLSLWILSWLDQCSWLLYVFPLFLIPLHFPDGKPPGPRWRWVNFLAGGMVLFLMTVVALSEEIGPFSELWALPNPIGFVPNSFFDGPFIFFWLTGLMTVVGASVTSLFVRFRGSPGSVREQIKWLLFGGVLFFVTYGLAVLSVATGSSWDVWGESGSWAAVAFLLSTLTLPIAIAIAIFRYRLYDIDLIIRRTLQYSLLTGLLALVYFGGVVVLQELFRRLTGEGTSPLATVISTLGIAALFTPLRSRTQAWIDRRFYRQKYDAEQALAQFASTARDEVDVDKFAAALMSLAGEAMHPEKVSIWLRPDPRHGGESV